LRNNVWPGAKVGSEAMLVLDKLNKMISLEIEQGYENKAVIGGLQGVLSWWPQEARKVCEHDQQQALIDKVIELIEGYETLSDGGARKEAIAEIQGNLAAIVEAGQVKAVGSPSTGNIVDTAPVHTPMDVADPAEAHPDASQDSPEPREKPSLAPRIERAPAPDVVAQGSDGRGGGERLGLDSPVTAISGIGPTQAKRLQRLGVYVIGDLLYFFPWRHEDYSKLKPIGKLQYGEQITIVGTIRSTKLKRTRGGAAIVNTIVADGSGSIQATWFNQPYLAEQFKRGRQIVLSGQVDEYLGRRVMQNPTWEPLEADLVHTGRLVPVYPLTQGLHARWLRRIMKRTIDYWTKRLPDYLPARVRERLQLMPLEQAVAQMHFPDDLQMLARARRRLSFDEFFVLQIGVLQQRRQWQSEPGIPVRLDRSRLDTFLNGLPYQLTGAQQRALDEILGDLEDDRPMSRLLQGDVGSGKTVVAAAAMLAVAAAGYQSTLMAPTEILSEQHLKTLVSLLTEYGVSVALLTGSVPRAEKDGIGQALAAGEIDVLVGTHAVIQQGVQFKNLALAIVDEQHRFGVRQRGALRSKGTNPHMLVMSATPIPRSLALTLYGDLDLAVIDEMPPGRQPIQTKWFTPAERERAYRFVRSQIDKGYQAYVICPLVEESDKVEAKAAVEEHQRLQKTIYPDLRLGLLHGRLRGEEKEEVMRQFGAHELDILVSTSVVEVGIDVPNATVMLIEGANRFGLSQLHQFRGRVGRGQAASYCILLSDATTDVSEERLRAIEDTNDGFKLAEKDLELRGPGDFFGTRQSGLPELKLASLGDTPLLELARQEAQTILSVDPALSHPDHRLLARKVKAFWSGEGDLS
jgi:ATP-dependent DNA helicase RecG